MQGVLACLAKLFFLLLPLFRQRTFWFFPYLISPATAFSNYLISYLPAMTLAMTKTSNPFKRTWQGRQDLNLQHPILETGALPIELRPCEQNKTNTITVQLYHIVQIIIIKNIARTIKASKHQKHQERQKIKRSKLSKNQTFVSAWNVCLLHFGQYFLILSLSFLLFSFVV